MLNVDTIRQWIELDRQRKDHETDIEKIKEQMKFLEEVILENFASEGIQSCKVNGFTISPQPQIFAVIVEGDKERAYQALRDAGYGQYITESVNTRSLSALVSDLIKTDGKLPDEFIGAISTFEKTKLRKTKT